MSFVLAVFGVNISLLIGFVLCLGLVFAVMNFKAAKDVAKAGRSQLGRIGRAAMNADPMANYKQAIDDEVGNVNVAKQQLSEAGVLVRSVRRQVDNNKSDITRLSSRIRSALAEGNDARAREYAEQLARAEEGLKANEAQLGHHEAVLQKAKDMIGAHTNKLSDVRREASSLELKLNMAKQSARTQQVLNSTTLDRSSLDSQRDRVLEEIDRYDASAEMTEIGSDRLKFEQQERGADISAAADDVLNRFKNEENHG